MITYFFFMKDILTVKNAKNPKKPKTKEVHVSSNAVEVNKTVHTIFF